jgi:hypothetical protein
MVVGVKLLESPIPFLLLQVRAVVGQLRRAWMAGPAEGQPASYFCQWKLLQKIMSRRFAYYLLQMGNFQ